MTQFHYDFYQRGPQPAMVMVHGFHQGFGILPDGSLIHPRHLHAMPSASISTEAHPPGALGISETGRSVDPAPAPTTMTDAERAVIEAAEKWEPSIRGAQFSSLTPQARDLTLALDALRKSLAPVDPVAEVKAVWTDLRDRGYTADWTQRMDAAIAALSERGV